MNALDLSPLIYDETDDLHRTDYPGNWLDLYLAKHLYYQAGGSTTQIVSSN